MLTYYGNESDQLQNACRAGTPCTACHILPVVVRDGDHDNLINTEFLYMISLECQECDQGEIQV